MNEQISSLKLALEEKLRRQLDFIVETIGKDIEELDTSERFQYLGRIYTRFSQIGDNYVYNYLIGLRGDKLLVESFDGKINYKRDEYKTQGDAIKDFRKQAKITQVELSMKTHVSNKTISDTERRKSKYGRTFANEDALTRIAGYFNLSDDEIEHFIDLPNYL